MVKAPVKVVIRTRPTANFAYKNIKIDETSGYVGINIPKDQLQGYVNHQQEDWGFTFDKVLQNAGQEVVFDVCAKEIVNSVLEGYSGTILCYGQTGAGKTFTQTGSTTDYKYRGIIPRAISMLYQEIQGRYEQQINIGVSYLEIYNEQMTDLLAESLAPNSEQPLAIQEDNDGKINVKGLLVKQCRTEEEAQQMIFEGETNRTIGIHQLNKNSSRSHCVFTVHLEIRSKVESSEKVIVSKLNLVDLAGSERTKKTGSEGKNLLEAQFINKSLSFLEQVVVALSERNREHIPYRQSKLTNLLKDSIGGHCKTIMIANVWPEESHLEETISTLKFASRMMKVSNEAIVQLKLDPSVLLKKYEREIRDLKQELAMHDTLANRGRIQYDPYSPEQQYEIQKKAKQFLTNEIDDLEFDSLRQVKEYFFQFKNLYNLLAKDIDNKNVVFKGEVTQTKQEIPKQQQDGKKIEGVGSETYTHGFGIGKARLDARPQQNIENLVNIPKEEFQQLPNEQIQVEKIEDPIEAERKESKKIVNIDKNEAYKIYKEGDGQEYNEQILTNISTLKQKKQEINQLTVLCTQIKQSIEDLKDQLDRKQANKNQEEIAHGIIDEDEFEIIKQLKIQKREYKDQASQIRELKSDIIVIDQTIINAKTQFLTKFEEWFQKRYGITVDDIDNPLINQPSDAGDAKSDKADTIDSDALAYIRAKKKVSALQKARKQEKYKNQA
ncbi:P-loop containing nucleoside triphosphate hydrolase [Pseudocohnilembus persalinus]|uniref:Kinesin-like protein n=1 Tax=Pseudocohnilembus persalinus TaxID=266149 RepID=A0A0V0QPM7_PSEPJ|nr:P-loop containing nucleoside triphosphate hydrolase [Pseudocohnilembus persalinus]|eukprot:KRX04254.1 P-loop containing nucleoside triphosphate hydrolase [Pseudocohnilembus persalinus]